MKLKGHLEYADIHIGTAVTNQRTPLPKYNIQTTTIAPT